MWESAICFIRQSAIGNGMWIRGLVLSVLLSIPVSVVRTYVPASRYIYLWLLATLRMDGDAAQHTCPRIFGAFCARSRRRACLPCKVPEENKPKKKTHKKQPAHRDMVAEHWMQAAQSYNVHNSSEWLLIYLLTIRRPLHVVHDFDRPTRHRSSLIHPFIQSTCSPNETRKDKKKKYIIIYWSHLNVAHRPPASNNRTK